MPANDLSREVIDERLNVLKANGGNIQAAAAALGLPRQTLQSTIRIAKKRGLFDKSEPLTDGGIELPPFPDDDVPIENVIGHLATRFRKKRASYSAHTWFPVTVKDRKPIGLLLIGDPHLDDSGCDWDLLQEHARICRETPGVYAINIGDSTNCWGGRLIKKYADQDTSLKTARRLVEWFLLDSGINWLVWLYGNHEHMGDGSALLAQMAKRFGTKQVVMHDWEARFVLRFPGEKDIRVYAAHDFPGNSMWNPNHGPVKAARFGNNIDLLVCGHKHNWAVSQWEMAEQESTPLMIRVRGYKWFDDFTKRLGIVEQSEGAAVLAVINPDATSKAGRIVPFVDISEGANYLTYLRQKAE